MQKKTPPIHRYVTPRVSVWVCIILCIFLRFSYLLVFSSYLKLILRMKYIMLLIHMRCAGARSPTILLAFHTVRQLSSQLLLCWHKFGSIFVANTTYTSFFVNHSRIFTSHHISLPFVRIFHSTSSVCRCAVVSLLLWCCVLCRGRRRRRSRRCRRRIGGTSYATHFCERIKHAYFTWQPYGN